MQAQRLMHVWCMHAYCRGLYQTLDMYQHLVGTWRVSGRAVRSTLHEFHWEPDCIVGTTLAFDAIGCTAACMPLSLTYAHSDMLDMHVDGFL